MLLTSFDTIPETLRELPAWIVAHCTPLPTGRIDKKPLSPRTGQLCDVTDPKVAVSYAEAVSALRRGIGTHLTLVMRSEYELTCTDLDKCRGPDGKLHPAAAQILARLDTYAEASASGGGAHAFARGVKPGTRCRRSMPWGGGIEVYDQARCIVVTGRRLAEYPGDVQLRHQVIDDLYAELFGHEAASVLQTGPLIPTAPNLVGLNDDDLIRRMLGGRNGARFRRLFVEGDTSGFPSSSEADLSLMNDLAFFTNCDAERIKRLFLRSALMRPKSKERDDYLDRTIRCGINSVQRIAQQRAFLKLNGKRND